MMRSVARGNAWRAAVLSFLIASTSWTANAGGDPPSATTRAPNIVLVSMDTVRADHLGSYGYGRPTTPHLDRFAARATLYTRAHTTAPWTLPAHASLFTGLYPTEHGSQMVRLEPGTQPRRALPLSDAFTTIAEVLRDRGYETAGIAANFLYLAPEYGLDRGFDHWEVGGGQADVSADTAVQVNESVLAWLGSRRDPDRPFFLFVNYMDAHSPYNTAPREDFPGHPVPPFDKRDYRRTQDLVMGSAKADPSEQLATVIDQYDLGLANLDAGIGALFAELTARDLFDDALVIVVSDHGEFLGEHRLLGHAKDVYEGTMWVPLLVKKPKQGSGEREGRQISLVHLPRLMLVASGLGDQAPKGAFPHRWPTSMSFGENHYSLWADLMRYWGHRFDRIREALYQEDQKFIHSSDGDHELFDLSSDPEEERNLLQGHPEKTQQWLERMKKTRPSVARRKATDSDTKPLSEKELEQLRSLGYVD